MPGAAAPPPALRRARTAAHCAHRRNQQLQKCVSLGDEGLRALLRAMPSVRVLNLSACTALREPRVDAPAAEALHLYNCTGLRGLELACPRLRTLNLTYCAQLAEVRLGAEPPAQLESALLVGCARLPDAPVHALVKAAAAGADALAVVDLRGCAALGAPTLEAVTAHCQRVLAAATAAAAAAVAASEWSQ